MSILVAVRDRLLDVSPILPLRGQDVLALRRRGFGARQLAQGEPADWLVPVLYVLEQLDPTITLPDVLMMTWPDILKIIVPLGESYRGPHSAAAEELIDG